MRFELGDGAEVSVGPASDAWVVRTHLTVDTTDDDSDVEVSRELTVRIESLTLTDQAHAEQALESAGNAALFELDRALGVGLRLRTSGGGTPIRRDVSSDLPTRLTREYDREPMSLYWYARTAEAGMPLLAFLAFYQVLEFYFPLYSRRGAMQALRESLRGLSFDSLRDADLAKILSAVRTGGRRSFGNELEQLKATLKHCVGQNSLQAFFESDADRLRFYASDDCARLAPTRVPIGGSSDDWRGDVARRVYEVRNRVVHAKSQHGEDPDPLLPFDPEANLLWHDVALVSFLAREALSASAVPFGGTPGSSRLQDTSS